MTAGEARQPQEIDPRTAHELVDAGKATIIDVRESDEYAREHIPGARLMPLSKLDPSEIPQSNGSRVILHCRSGTRSTDAANRLLASGHEQVAHLKGGLNAWKKAGLPIEGDRRAPISVMRQVQITVGSFVLAATVLGAFVSPWFLVIVGFMGAGLIFAGTTGTCGMAAVLARMPWNRRYNNCCSTECSTS